jgi:hypothetical protein
LLVRGLRALRARAARAVGALGASFVGAARGFDFAFTDRLRRA